MPIMETVGAMEMLVSTSAAENLESHDSDVMYTTARRQNDDFDLVPGKKAAALRDAISNLSSYLGNAVDAASGPDELSIELTLSFEQSVGFWKIGAASAQGIKVEARWKRKEEQ